MPLKNMVLSGSPGVDKTSLIKECFFPFTEKFSGFYTEEMREGNERKGFVIKTTDGQSSVFAEKGRASKHKFQKYGLDLNVLESLAIPAIEKAEQSNKIALIDEIGPMEMASASFCAAIARVLSGGTRVLATIRPKSEPFTSQIKKMTHTKLILLNRDNRVQIKSEIRNWIEEN